VTAGTWQLDSTGRVTLAGVNGASSFQLYLDGNGRGLIMSLDAQDSTAGPAFQQVVSSSDIAEGTYAVVAQGATDAAAWGAVGSAKVNDGDIDGAIDYTPEGDDPTAAVPLSGSIDSQGGTLSLTGLNAQDRTKPESFTYFPIDENRTLAIEISGRQRGLVWLEAAQSGDDSGGDDDDD
jgi:hypothetical protein